MKKKHIAMLTASLAAAIPVGARAQAAAPDLTTVSLAAEAEVRGAPDVADITAGVVTQAADASAALSANASRMQAVVGALRKAGVAERDIQTSTLNLQPEYSYPKEGTPVLNGYRANNQVQVTLRDLRNAGKVIDALVAQGANQIDGPSFRIDRSDELMDKARAEAVRKGRARADLYAQAAGMRVKRLISITETGSARPPVPVMRAMAVSADAKEASPVAEGEVSLVARLQMLFELQ